MCVLSFVLTPVGPNFKTLVTPLVKHVRLHLISPKDLVEVSTGLLIPCSCRMDIFYGFFGQFFFFSCLSK